MCNYFSIFDNLILSSHLFESIEFLGVSNSNFSGYQICQQIVHKIVEFHLHFQLKSKQEGKTSYLKQETNLKMSKQLSKNKIKQTILYST